MPLDETQTLAQQRVENESIVYWVERKGSDQWEEVQIQKPEATSEENKWKKNKNISHLCFKFDDKVFYVDSYIPFLKSWS